MLTENLQKLAKENICKICDHNTSNQTNYSKHILTAKNTQLTSVNKNLQKTCKKETVQYFCEACDYITVRKSSFNTHLLTAKHKNATLLTTVNKNLQKTCKKEADNFTCNLCDKEFKSRVGLWKHKKNCNEKVNNNIPKNNTNNTNNILSNIVITPDLIIELIKTHSDDIKHIILEQNNTFQNTIQTLVTNSQNIIQNNSNNNSNNKSFNLQVFLNETCKNAMNIIDFANSIKIQLTDLEQIGELGYVDGISKIIVDNLKLLDITERPVHCSDFKRESLYVKNNENKWEKENEENKHLKKLINSVANKNIPLIQEWKQKYPDSNKCDSIKSTQINKIIMEVMETDHSKKEKIIKNIAKEVIIDKNI